MATLTYYCGESGNVRKYDHSTSLWSNISIANVKTLYDIMAFPGNSTKVIAVGESVEPNTDTIWYSTNAGSTWTASTINPNPITATIPTSIYEVWVTDATYVYAVGYDATTATPVILRSINGGATFDHTSIPASSGQVPALALHFPTATTGVVAIGNKIYYTENSTVTWNPTNGDLPILVNGQTTAQIKGIHIFQQGVGSYRITALADQGIVQSLDSGLSYLTRHNYGIRIGEHLTWFGNSNFWATDLNGGILFSETAGVTWGIATPTVLGSPDNVRGAHFYKIVSTVSPVTTFEGFICANFNTTSQVSITSQNTSAIPLTFPANLTATGVSDSALNTEFYAVWTEYENTVCVRLKECNGTKEVIIKDIAVVGTGVLLSSFGVGASVTINWSAGNNVSPCLFVTDNFPTVCWTIEEIIEECAIVGTCEEVIP